MASTAPAAPATARAGTDRPAVDVVVPFSGRIRDLTEVCRRLRALNLRGRDSLIVVDNTPKRSSIIRPEGVNVMHCSDQRTPGFARNRGAAQGTNEWLLFLDADTHPTPDLLDRYFNPPPVDRTGLIGGGVLDEEAPRDGRVAARYAYLRRAMSQDRTFDFGAWGYPKSANVACRREAFEQARGFREDIRAAEDADLTYRLRAAGWRVERREHAAVVHLSRQTLGSLIRQQLLWGAGGAWIAREYPGALPLATGTGLARWAFGSTVRGALEAVRRGDRDALIYASIRPVEALAWELGRLRSNRR